ncbi:MAG TPA: hypothetical protein EYH56_01390 [Nanoarchaeota archaeon]|nr:hypothetical protein [Nanoarchaeota archaeon]
MKKGYIENIFSSMITTILILILLFSIFNFISLSAVSKAQVQLPVDMSSTFSFLVETCFKDVIDPEKLESCVNNINEKIYIKVKDMFNGKEYEAWNTGLLEIHTVYSSKFIYPVKSGEEIHPAVVKIELRKFNLPWFLQEWAGA